MLYCFLVNASLQAADAIKRSCPVNRKTEEVRASGNRLGRFTGMVADVCISHQVAIKLFE
jgi:hypothetical protein